MQRFRDPNCSFLSGVIEPHFDKLNPAGQHLPGEDRSANRGRAGRGAGIALAGLLLLTLGVFAAPTPARAASIAIGVSVGVAPPPLPVYAQPVCPGPGFIWTPGYWSYDPVNGYFWVPGTWVMAPTPGFLWTPGYWGWGGAAFFWHAGYWGPHVGFYGGVNYGFGYPGVGFVGGEWRGREFFYNRAVNNFGGVHITNVYYHPVSNNFGGSHVSYNGGVGGLGARPTPGEMAAERDRHIEATSMQQQHEQAAHGERGQFVSENHGRPGVAATGRPGEFRGAGVVGAGRAGGQLGAGGVYGANNAHTTTYGGAHGPNPGGGGTRPLVTARSNPYNPGTGPAGNPQAHSTPPTHGASPHTQAPSYQAAPHAQSSQPHNAPPRPSGGERREPHGR